MRSDLTILFLGDVVGRAGRMMLKMLLEPLSERVDPDLTVVNIENIAGGRGPNIRVMEEIEDLPIDICTTGSHYFDQREFVQSWERYPRVIRPANYPEGNPGYDHVTLEVGDSTTMTVTQLMGRSFMVPIECPFRTADRLLCQFPEGPVLVDFHAEATSEKTAFGHYLDGRVSAVLGTHTHIPTADETILPGGTAYITDAGMVGAYDSVIGFKKEVILERFLQQTPRRFEPSRSVPKMSVVLLKIDPENGKARSIRRFFLERETDLDGISGS